MQKSRDKWSQWKDGHQEPFLKHGGGSVMVWGHIPASVVVDLVKIDKITNAEKDRNISIHNAKLSAKQL